MPVYIPYGTMYVLQKTQNEDGQGYVASFGAKLVWF